MHVWWRVLWSTGAGLEGALRYIWCEMNADIFSRCVQCVDDCWCVLLNQRSADLSSATSLHPPPSVLMNTAVCSLEKAPTVPLHLGGGDKVRLSYTTFWIKNAETLLAERNSKSFPRLFILLYPATTVCTIQNHGSIETVSKFIFIWKKLSPHWVSKYRQCQFVSQSFLLTNPFFAFIRVHLRPNVLQNKKKIKKLENHDGVIILLQLSTFWHCSLSAPALIYISQTRSCAAEKRHAASHLRSFKSIRQHLYFYN